MPDWRRAAEGTGAEMPLRSFLALLLACLAPVSAIPAALALTLTFAVPAALVGIVRLLVAIMQAPLLLGYRSWLGRSWWPSLQLFWHPSLWSWLGHEWLCWPWRCWKWLRWTR